MEISDGEFLLNHNFEIIVQPVNDPPSIIQDISQITIQEDFSYSIALDDVFEDVDSDLLFQAITDTSAISIAIGNNNLDIIPMENWYGESELIIIFSDDEFIDSVLINISVESVNDPLIQLSQFPR